MKEKFPRNLFGEDSSSGAIFSNDKKYRYCLWRCWDDKPPVAFIGLNPSTADENIDDPTIRRCINFAKSWGYGSMYVLNLFAFRATDPKIMKSQIDPVGGIANRSYLLNFCDRSSIVVAAWGAHGSFGEEAEWVKCTYDIYGGNKKLHHLGLTKGGHPKHPLYLKSDTKPQLWVF